ncbi:hypothetical protein [Lacrimispora sp.]|uniref:hypothetical protein n=1 Tax=Lacrimispora sp. TaxID=2719234 RepID=UPI00346081ED
MIKNPEHGWCEFNLGEFEGSPGYLTDVPVDLLKGFIEYFTTGVSCVWFDEEGSEFTLILTPYNIYVVKDDEDAELYSYPEIKPKDLANELISDIESDLDGWVGWETWHDNDDELQQHGIEIRGLIGQLKKLV